MIGVKFYGDFGKDLLRVTIVLWIALSLIGVSVIVLICFAIQVRVKNRSAKRSLFYGANRTKCLLQLWEPERIATCYGWQCK
jgi:uncharacterized membrane protein YqjE